MVFTKFVQVGRVAVINYGEEKNKVAVIVDILDHNRVLIDGPTTEVKRQIISIKRLNLTKFVIDLPRGSRTPTVKKAVDASEVVAKFNATSAGIKINAAAKRASLTDFERHVVVLAQKKRSKILKA